MRIGVIAVPGTLDSALTSVLDVLGVADVLRPTVDPEIPEIVTLIAGVGRSAVSHRGLTVPIEHQLLELGAGDLDLLVVPALGVFDAPGLGPALARPAARKMREVLNELGEHDRPRLAGACTGTFLLAEAGCLDGQRATTSWWLSGLFGERYPQVELDMSRMVVESGSIVTAGAAFAHIDLAISIVSHISPRLAELVAAWMLVDERPARSVAAALSHLARSDSLVSDLEDWIRANLGAPINLELAAQAIGTTRRTLERRTRGRFGITPLELVRRLRTERANHLRRTTEQSMEQIAHAVGYRNAATLRRLLQAEN
ncbi:MAG: helix-turn-helix domain-containing protein [Actinomycetota bacterium]|nr:helix-turn-helix domain-containing protein [Actinomycetota bacterium]